MSERRCNPLKVLDGTLCFLVFAVLLGCSRSAPSHESNEFFVTWLRDHGESNIVVDADGVGLAGKPIRLRWSLYESSQHSNGATAELEFRIRLPDDREIVEYVAGSGASPEKAENSAKLNFVLTTFHLIYGGFLNPKDSHYTEDSITNNGQRRLLALGDTMTLGQTTNDSPDMFPLRDSFRKIVSAQPFSPQTHWIKIVYANHHSRTKLCSVTLDNEESPVLTEAFQNLPWPKHEEFYMVKQFIIVK